MLFSRPGITAPTVARRAEENADTVGVGGDGLGDLGAADYLAHVGWTDANATEAEIEQARNEHPEACSLTTTGSRSLPVLERAMTEADTGPQATAMAETEHPDPELPIFTDSQGD